MNHLDPSSGAGIRVLVIFGAIPLYGQERGNIEVFSALREAGMQARFLINARHGHLSVQPELDRLGFEYGKAPFGPRLGRKSPVRDWLSAFSGVVLTNLALWREIRRWKPTHLHLMNPLYGMYASPVLFLTRLPLIYRIGDAPPVASPLDRAFWKLLARRIFVLSCNADYTRKLCSESGFPPEKLRRIHSSARSIPARDGAAPASSVRLHIAHYHSVGEAVEGWHEREEATVEAAPGVCTLLFCGQLTRNKGIHLVVEAALHLLREGRRLRLLVAGDYHYRNPFAQALVEQVRQEGQEQAVQFLGYVENAPDLFSIADLHLCPSLWNEPLANTVLEAKAAGIPSIVFPKGGLPEVVRHGVDGWVCQELTADGLAEAIRFYLDHPEELRRQGEAARASGTGEGQFGRDRFRREWLAVFRETLKS